MNQKSYLVDIAGMISFTAKVTSQGMDREEAIDTLRNDGVSLDDLIGADMVITAWETDEDESLAPDNKCEGCHTDAPAMPIESALAALKVSAAAAGYDIRVSFQQQKES